MSKRKSTKTAAGRKGTATELQGAELDAAAGGAGGIHVVLCDGSVRTAMADGSVKAAMGDGSVRTG